MAVIEGESTHLEELVTLCESCNEFAFSADGDELDPHENWALVSDVLCSERDVDTVGHAIWCAVCDCEIGGADTRYRTAIVWAD